MASTKKEFAIVVFGASGFTGQFVVREVAKNCKGKFKWAVAGRSKDKLEKVLQETASELGTYRLWQAAVISVREQKNIEVTLKVY